ncbi:MAG: hypothetical protein AB7S48_09980 [Bacteroidales bacterium]
MKKIALVISSVILFVLAVNAQNTNVYQGAVNYDGKDYYYETTCAGIKPMATTTIETYGLIIYKVKKNSKKPYIKTHCTALEVKRNDSSVKDNLDKIKFSTVVSGKLSPEVEGTSKKITLEFQLDNYTLIPQYNPDARRGCASFDDAMKNVVYFILKELD